MKTEIKIKDKTYCVDEFIVNGYTLTVLAHKNDLKDLIDYYNIVHSVDQSTYRKADIIVDIEHMNLIYKNCLPTGCNYFIDDSAKVIFCFDYIEDLNPEIANLISSSEAKEQISKLFSK